MFDTLCDNVVTNTDAHNVKEKKRIIDALKLINWVRTVQYRLSKNFIIFYGLILKVNLRVKYAENVPIWVSENDVVISWEMVTNEDKCQS